MLEQEFCLQLADAYFPHPENVRQASASRLAKMMIVLIAILNSRVEQKKKIYLQVLVGFQMHLLAECEKISFFDRRAKPG